MSEVLDLGDLAPIEVPVTFRGEKFTLREADTGAACEFRNAGLRCTKFNNEGRPVGMDGAADIEPLLVSLCLWDSKDKLVPKGKILTWPARTVKKLFAKALEISDLNEGEEAVEVLEKQLADAKARVAARKNGQGGTETV